MGNRRFLNLNEDVLFFPDDKNIREFVANFKDRCLYLKFLATLYYECGNDINTQKKLSLNPQA